MNHQNSSPTDSFGDIFDVVCCGIDEWITSHGSRGKINIKNKIYNFIKEYLVETGNREVAAEMTYSKYITDCDIAIGDEIGIAIVYDLPNKTDWIHQRLRALSKHFNYIAIYGHRIRQEKTDVWRNVKKTINTYSGRAHSNQKHSVVVLQTFDLIEYRIPLTRRYIAKNVIQKLILYLMWIVFTVTGAYLLDATSSSNVLSQAYIGAILAFNVVVILFLVLLVRM
ncbi:hypothetical protein [Natrinema halophilum]|uniref:hypothetical protein n=1 Tax=Natrinema halophilum TaxID=1699371 RepID=UPI001F447530|nr:hypothetical protein [Natrinema halophilum]UHQ96199.1 hypothetical protein HYG82_23050 [Natrinema halophilum]